MNNNLLIYTFCGKTFHKVAHTNTYVTNNRLKTVIEQVKIKNVTKTEYKRKGKAGKTNYRETTKDEPYEERKNSLNTRGGPEDQRGRNSKRPVRKSNGKCNAIYFCCSDDVRLKF